MKDLLKEQLAAIEHERWAHWQEYLHSVCTRNPDGSLTIPADKVKRWERQMDTCYQDLTETEKNSDRLQVDRYWPLIEAKMNNTADDLQDHLKRCHRVACDYMYGPLPSPPDWEDDDD